MTIARNIPSALLGALLLAVSLFASATDGWPGAPPDCWSTSRMVHGVADYESVWTANVSVQRVSRRKLDEAVPSPNTGYQFALTKSGKRNSLRIDAEKTHQTRIRFDNVHFLGEIRWINEKLVSGRVWWGHIAATDFIFDVEAEVFVWHESATESTIAMDQFHSDCPRLGGCTCIQAQPTN